MRSPGNIIRPCGCAVLVYQLLDHFARVVQLIKIVLEYVLFAELLQEGFALTQFVVLPARPLKQLWENNRRDFETKIQNRNLKLGPIRHLSILHAFHFYFSIKRKEIVIFLR